MTAIPKGQDFADASEIERAVPLLKHAFGGPLEGVSRVNVARTLDKELKPAASGVLGGSGSADPENLRAVAVAWQLLEQARMICPDPTHPDGDWWVLTPLGASARAGSDPEGEISTPMGAL